MKQHSTVSGKLPRIKVRMGVFPTRVEANPKKEYRREEKHRRDYRDA